MLPSPSTRLSEIPPYLFAELDRKIDAARAEGRDVISLGIGDPDLPTPKPIIDAMAKAIYDPATHTYPPYRGTVAFRECVADWMQSRFGVTVDAATEAMALIGSKEGIAHLIAAYVEAGKPEKDVILCPSPGYPVYQNYTILCGGEPYTLPLKAENDFLPDYSQIPADVLRRAKILFLNYPNNPTGALAPDSFIQETIALCQKHNILLCHDNAYSEMTFDGYQAPSFLAYPGAKDVCIEMFSLSKMYNMTGWRIAFAVGNKAAIDALGVVKSNGDSGAFKAVQEAAMAALKQPPSTLAELNTIYGKRRELFVQGLNDLGWDYALPKATFFLWVPVPPGLTDVEFCNTVLEQCDVVLTPGSGCGSAGGGFFRVALTQPEDRIREVLSRMKAKGFSYQMGAASEQATQTVSA
jgi:LL-diaminopimelate aminotransferase